MALFQRSKEVVDNVKIVTPKDIFLSAVKTASGSGFSQRNKFNIFNKVVAFKGVVGGVGTSTLVSNVAFALAEHGLSVCVFDTSMLAPSQDIYLRTEKNVNSNGESEDWFTLPYTKKNVLNKSKINSNIEVLSFTKRGITDLVSMQDDAFLVELALRELVPKFDIILIDICSEPTSVAVTCMQKAHQLIQVWSNDTHSLNTVDNFVRDNVTLCCAVDKMRYVVTSKVNDDLRVDWDDLLSKYNFKRLSGNVLCKDVSRIMCSGDLPFNFAIDSDGVQSFTDCIYDIAGKLLGANEQPIDTGKLTMDGIAKKRQEEEAERRRARGIRKPKSASSEELDESIESSFIENTADNNNHANVTAETSTVSENNDFDFEDDDYIDIYDSL